ncbi:ATP-binding cassette domain-containing protein [Mycoplasmopsis adleri]|uniref:ATP-binding cassette domain-containing protein n=1 Tax=Mycoplasmopsis adleri TaxID=51362 RepID=UPI00387304BF
MKNKDSKVIFDIQGLKKYFFNNGRVNKAVDNVSFNVHAGEIVGLIGESGSGKTTVGRSLLRLYDDFSGFVTLDDKIISGNKITSKRNRFLRKNIQMIFQDPHASLNGQKTIFNILKEPLVVNNIIKSKTNDLFSDWKDVKKNFKFTFKRKVKELKIENLRSINNLAKDFFPKWTQIFTDFSFDWEESSIEDNFISYFNYLEEKQNMESQIISNMYSNTDELMSFYYEKQKQFRDQNLTDDEKQLLESTKNLERIRQLTTMSQNKYDAINRKKIIKSELEEFKNNFNDGYETSKGAYDNFISECKNDCKITHYAKIFTYDPDFYFFNYKKEVLLKYKLAYLKRWRSELRYLKIDQLKELINELELYSESFFQEFLENVPLRKKYKEIVKYLFEQNFNFDYSKYLNLNAKSLLTYEEETGRLKELIKDCNSIIDIKEAPACSQQDLEEAERQYNEASKYFEAENVKYAEKIKSDIKRLDLEIVDESLLYKKLKSQQTYIDTQFKAINNAFFKKLENDYKQAKAKCNKKDPKEVAAVKSLKKMISIYRNKIQNKLSTLKSFQIEVNYFFKDVRTIYLLLGVEKTDNKLTNWWNNLFAKQMISRLLTKSIIYKALEDVGLLKQFAYRYPHEFSGGQRQRIVIARALITEPKVIVADEPIASLDISIQAQVVNLLKDLCEKKNIGMVFIAHDLSMIEYIADRVQIMHLGKIVESGNTDVVYHKPMHPYTINLFKAIPKISNANEKFENISFELDYLKDQQYPNVPRTYLVEKDHYLFGTKSQVESWIHPFKLANPKLVQNLKVVDEDDQDTTHLPFDGRKEIPDNIEYTLLVNTPEETTEVKVSSLSFGKTSNEDAGSTNSTSDNKVKKSTPKTKKDSASKTKKSSKSSTGSATKKSTKKDTK